MREKYFLAIDAGTGSVRAVLFDTEGNQRGIAQREWFHHEDTRYPGSMDFDWNTNWDLATTCIKEVLETSKIDPSDILSISTTCMREGIVLYNKSGQEIWACANVDARSTKEAIYLKNLDSNLEKKLYAKSGQTFTLNAIPRILWVKNNLPEVYEQIDKVGMFNDWLIYKLSGVLSVDPSNGSTSGLIDLSTREWDKSIAESCGIKSDIFPPVSESGTLIAHVNKESAKTTGLSEGTPLVVGGGDAQLGSIGVGVTENNQGAIFGGSFWQYEYNTDKWNPKPTCRVRVNCHASKDLLQYEALAFKPGLVMRWYRDAFLDYEKVLAKEQNKSVYEIMDEKAKDVPVGSNGVMCTFSDIMNFLNWKHASPTFTNFQLEPDKFNKVTFYRAILENTAYLAYGHVNLVKEETGKIPSYITFAGGASYSDLWSQILCDVLGMEVRIPVIKEATAFGAAILAGVGVGYYSDIKSATKKLVKIEKSLTPNLENHKKYMELYSKWREIYAAQLKLSDQKLTEYLWIAPGCN